jgi:molybdopterin molybdotransferase
MLELEAALQHVLSAVQPIGTESVQLTAAEGRVLAETVASGADLPPFDNSAMDGYAVRAADLARAAAGQPVSLRLLGRVPAGDVFAGTLEQGACVRLFTGSPLPAGADAVVMQEEVRVESSQPDAALFTETVKPWENVRFRGEDVKRDSTLAQAGERITAGMIGLLAATGVPEVRVGKRPVVALIATGSELIESGEPPAPGRIHESNRAMLAALMARVNAVPRVYPLVRDSLDATRSALQKAFEECDAVVSSGGVSVGEFDFVKQAFERLGGQPGFWKVAIRPGKPFTFGRRHDQFLFGLPGNPVSAMVTFLLLVRPALWRMQGAARTGLPVTPGVLAEPVDNHGDRRHFIRVSVGEEGRVRLAGTQASHMLHSLARANGLVDVPPRTTWPTGTPVMVLRWDG